MSSSKRISYLLCLAFLFAASMDCCLANSIEPTILGVSLQTILTRTLSYLLKIISSLVLMVLVASGIFYMASTGNAERQKKAKGMVFAAVEGIIVIIASYAVIELIDRLVVD